MVDLDIQFSMKERNSSVSNHITVFVTLSKQEDLPETVRQTKERMLKSLQQEITDKETEKRSKKVAKKYRMVKFFGMYMCVMYTRAIQ